MPLKPYWVTFKTKSAVCVEAENPVEAAKLAAAHVGEAASDVKTLPYPAHPRIGTKSDCPSFCYKPRECAGRGCCHQRISCTE